jgi:hypothetical protein
MNREQSCHAFGVLRRDAQIRRLCYNNPIHSGFFTLILNHILTGKTRRIDIVIANNDAHATVKPRTNANR